MSVGQPPGARQKLTGSLRRLLRRVQADMAKDTPQHHRDRDRQALIAGLSRRPNRGQISQARIARHAKNDRVTGKAGRR